VNADVFVFMNSTLRTLLLALATAALVLLSSRRVPSEAEEAREEGDAALR